MSPSRIALDLPQLSSLNFLAKELLPNGEIYSVTLKETVEFCLKLSVLKIFESTKMLKKLNKSFRYPSLSPYIYNHIYIHMVLYIYGYIYMVYIYLSIYFYLYIIYIII